MKGWILDIYPDLKTGKMVLWVRDKKHCYKVRANYDPVYYVNSDEEGLQKLEEYYRKKDFRTERVERRTDIHSSKLEELLAVHPGKVFDPKDQIQALSFFRGFESYEFYNVDIPLDQRYLIDKGIKPMSLLKNEGGWQDLEDEETINYSKPPLRTVHLEVYTDENGGERRNAQRLVGIDIGDEKLRGDERNLILGLNRVIEKKDPDIILTSEGDEFLIPYLARRAELNSVRLKLGREAALHPPKEGSWYESYGRVVYRPPSYPLKGRIHIDTENSFLYRQGRLDGLIEASRLSKVPIQRLCRRSPGSLIDAMEIKQALKDGYLVPWKKNLSEDFKNSKELLKADRGGHILEPKTGLHQDVIKLDFASMYPSIIDKYNLSPETLHCTCGNYHEVPGLGYRVCERKEGIIPKVVAPLIKRRQKYKRSSTDNEEFKRRADVLKWVLVTCFGYTGYKKARFNCIEVHESITAYARRLFLDAVESARKMDFRVLHGIVDSLWLKGERQSIPTLTAEVKERTQLELEEEGIYSWIVFLPNLSNASGASNRYYGVLEDEMEVKGMHAVRSDTPQFFKDTQKEMLEEMRRSSIPKKLNQVIEELLSIVKARWIRLKNREVEPAQLLFTKTASKRAEEYKNTTEVKSALMQYKDKGNSKKPGQTVTYLVTDRKSKDEQEKVKVGETQVSSEDYDTGFYEDHLFRTAEEVMLPFGYDRDDIKKDVKTG
ncbi:MAG: DNA polymerase domain-containing protein [Candidatus Thermoplasmatota archaeon]